MQLIISGTKDELARTIADLNFKAGRMELSTPEVVAGAVKNGNGHRRLSAEARKRIGDAQRARWAKVRRGK